MIDPLTAWQPLFAGHDDQLYDLPPDVLAHRTAVTRIDSGLSESAPDPDAERAKALDATRKAALTAKPWPNLASLDKAEADARDAQRRHELLAETRHRLASELLVIIRDTADTIIGDYLRPRHNALVKRFAETCGLLPATLGHDTILRSDESARQAWLTMTEDVATYQRIRQTAEHLNRQSPPRHDSSGEFALMRNLATVWPPFKGPTWQVRQAPWVDDDPRVTYVWLVRNGADLWLPTSAERDEAWWATYGEAVQEHQQNRRQGRALASLVGGGNA